MRTNWLSLITLEAPWRRDDHDMNYVSNDADEQERVAFDNNDLYCREGTNSNGDVVIYIEYEDKGQEPKVDESYH